MSSVFRPFLLSRSVLPIFFVYCCYHHWSPNYFRRDVVGVSCDLSTRLERMHWMDARVLRREDAFRGEMSWGDIVCDSLISDLGNCLLVAGSESKLGFEGKSWQKRQYYSDSFEQKFLLFRLKNLSYKIYVVKIYNFNRNNIRSKR